MSDRITDTAKRKLVDLALALVDQQKARLLVPPQERASGYWFGGGNMMLDGMGALWMVGRYRNSGDSRTGLAAGERGLELALFRAENFNSPFEKVKSFSKADLAVEGRRVLSIEGSSLYRHGDEIELYLSSEKDAKYPPEQLRFQKPGTGVWSIDVICADSPESLDAGSIKPVLTSDYPPTLHVKDPVVFDDPRGAGTAMIYCSHPFSWSSTNTGLAVRGVDETAFTVVSDAVLGRGFVWDVAVTRVTDRMPIPRLGMFASLPPISLYFYDGAECIRPHEQSSRGVKRPRGYSCEEISGLAFGFDSEFPKMERLSINFPLFVSPMGTGCSRYTSTLVTDDAILAIWQQSQDDLSQPLVGNSLPMEEVERILT